MTERHDSEHTPATARRWAEAPAGPAPQTSGRYIALRWQLTATYHPSLSEAEGALVGLPASERAGIVDSQTGRTLASQAYYPAVEAAVKSEVLGLMKRDGPLGDLAAEHRRALPAKDNPGRRDSIIEPLSRPGEATSAWSRALQEVSSPGRDVRPGRPPVAAQKP